MKFKPACTDESAKATLWQTSCAIAGPFLEATDGESDVQAQVTWWYFFDSHTISRDMLHGACAGPIVHGGRIRIRVRYLTPAWTFCQQLALLQRVQPTQPQQTVSETMKINLGVDGCVFKSNSINMCNAVIICVDGLITIVDFCTRVLTHSDTQPPPNSWRYSSECSRRSPSRR